MAMAVMACAACRGERPPEAPASRGLLVDAGGALGAEATARVDSYLLWVAREYGVDYRVVLAAPGEQGAPALEAGRWFRELEVGAAAAGRGLLLWIDPAQRLARIEVGYALEAVVPDLSASWVLEAYLAPHLRGEALGASLEAAIEGLVDRLRPRLAELAASRAPAESGGAGADFAPSSPPAPARADAPAAGLAPRADPRATRDLELEQLAAGRYDPTAPFYDEAWRRAAQPRDWRPERLRELGRRFDRPYQIASDGEHAVAYYPGEPSLGPTLLLLTPEGWRIDATRGARLIVYDYSNESWYLLDEPSPYLDLLRRALPLERVRLDSGRPAWRVP